MQSENALTREVFPVSLLLSTCEFVGLFSIAVQFDFSSVSPKGLPPFPSLQSPTSWCVGRSSEHFVVRWGGGAEVFFPSGEKLQRKGEKREALGGGRGRGEDETDGWQKEVKTRRGGSFSAPIHCAFTRCAAGRNSAGAAFPSTRPGQRNQRCYGT